MKIEKTLEELTEELNQINDEADKICLESKSYDEYLSAIESIYKRKTDVMSKINLLSKPVLIDMNDLTAKCKLPMKEFIECCNNRLFIDDDGYGKYATEDKISNICIYPSHVCSGIYRKDFDYVCWFNR